MKDNSNQIILPERLVSSVDLSRTIRELEAVDESLRQARLRKAGESTKLARSSTTLEELARLNNVALTDDNQREQLIQLLRAFHKHAPRIHMSLAAEPSGRFVQRIVTWMRQNVNPVLLVEVGLQPTLAAGCQIRTSNKIFDMSLRHRFEENKHMLVEKIREVEAQASSQADAEVQAVIAAATAVPQSQAPAGGSQ